MDYHTHFRVTKRGIYLCGCDTRFDDIDDAIYHCENGEIDGFCENGIRRNYTDSDVMKDEFECVCGKKGDWYAITEEHHDLFKKTCMTERIRKQNSYCKYCDLQSESVRNYEIHCKTNKHKQNEAGRSIGSLICDICNIKCRGQIEMETHLKTKKHINRLNAPRLDLECKLCDIKCLSQKQMQAHLKTKKHITNTESKCMIKALKLDSRECKLCGLDFNGPVQLERHTKTKRHLNKVKQPLLCKVCNIRCPSTATLETHLKTKKHLKKTDSLATTLTDTNI